MEMIRVRDLPYIRDRALRLFKVKPIADIPSMVRIRDEVKAEIVKRTGISQRQLQVFGIYQNFVYKDVLIPLTF